MFSNAIPKADAYIKSLFPRSVSGSTLMIKLQLDDENVRNFVMFLDAGDALRIPDGIIVKSKLKPCWLVACQNRDIYSDN